MSGGPESPTQPLSNLIENLFKPLVPTLNAYIKADSTMYSCDISSLYNSITTKLGIETISYWLHKKREFNSKRLTNYFIIESVLFDGHMYLQLLGTAISTKCARLYACPTVGYLEETKCFPNKLPKYFNKSEC